MRPDVPTRPVRVLQLLADPRRLGGRPVDNPYTSLLTESLPRDRVETAYFRWRSIITEPFDVLHVHWPENSLRHPRLPGRIAKATLFAIFLARIRLQRKAVVRTVHNVQPHEVHSPSERWLLERLERMTTLRILLNATTPTPVPTRTVLIPHGHYRSWYKPRASVAVVSGRLINFGLIRPYKGTEELLTAFRDTSTGAGLSLHIAGAPSDTETAERLSTLAARDPRVQLDLRFLEEQELADAIAAAEVVVLPYRAMHNSGAVLLALSLARPVIVPSTDATELLVEEFGSEWVTTYVGPVDGPMLVELVRRVRAARRRGSPDLSLREWPAIARLHADAYESAVRLARQRASAASESRLRE